MVLNQIQEDSETSGFEGRNDNEFEGAMRHQGTKTQQTDIKIALCLAL